MIRFRECGWRIVGVFPVKSAASRSIQLYTVIIALVTLLLAFIARGISRTRLSGLIGKLRSLMKKVEEGELHLRYPSKTKDEDRPARQQLQQYGAGNR